MKQSLLEKLRCVRCGGSLKVLMVGERDALEVLEGTVYCKACSHSYGIRAGIVDMLIDDRPEITLEVNGNFRKSKERYADKTDGWLLGLPGSLAFEPGKDAGRYDHHNFFKVLEEVHIRKNDTVVDLGSGTTWTSNELARRSRCVIATDISTEKFIGLESARVFMERYGNYYERVRVDMCRLPFADGSVDVTLNAASLHHAHDIHMALKEIARVLKKGGKAVFVNEPSSHVLDARDPSERHDRNELDGYGWNENKYNIYEYRKAIVSAGLRIEKVFYPESVRMKLKSLAGGNGNGRSDILHSIFKVLATPYSRSPVFRALAETVLFYPLLAAGVPFCAVATK